MALAYFCKALMVAASLLVLSGVCVHGQQSSIPAGVGSQPATSTERGGEEGAEGRAHIDLTGSPLSQALPIPPAEVNAQAESVTVTLRTIEADLSSDHVSAQIAHELPILIREIDPRLEENSQILIANPSLTMLNQLESGWHAVVINLSAWSVDLAKHARLLARDTTHLEDLDGRWKATLNLAQSSGVPEATLRRIEKVLAHISKTVADVDRRRAQLIILQNNISAEHTRITEMLTDLKEAHDEVFDHLLIQDRSPIWSAGVGAPPRQNLVSETKAAFTAQFKALHAYAERKTSSFLLHSLVILLLAVALYHVRGRAQSLVKQEPELNRAAQVFEAPGTTAVLLSILLSGWIYPQAPRLLSAILGAAALIPTILILRRLIERPLYPILNALVAFYLVDQVREVVAASQLLSRWLFLGEFFTGILLLVWLLRSELRSAAADLERDRLWKTIWVGTRLTLALTMIAFVANLLGYVNLADYLGNATLHSVRLAAVLYTLVHVIDGLIAFALRVRPLNLLEMVRRHHQTLRQRLRFALQVGGVCLWISFVLAQLGLSDLVYAKTRAVLNANLALASFHFTPGQVILFAITVWASFLLSRFLRFLLDEDVYPRIRLEHGLPYAISTLLHYVILLVGFYVAVAALGFDMTRFAILAGAFGVGFGFGLQSIINNFVSGLILLFERPIKVGDVIQLDETMGAVLPGVVERIGIRASIIRIANGSELIVPNSKLISDRVTNWTFSNRTRKIQIPVSVPTGTDPQRIMAILQGVATAHPLVNDSPPPEALFIKFSPGALDFELQAWTDHYEEWERIRSDLATGIHEAFVKENISVPLKSDNKET